MTAEAPPIASPSDAPPAEGTASRPPEPTKQKGPLWRRLLPIVLTVLLLAYVARTINFRAFADALSQLNYPAYMGFAFAWGIALCAGDTLGTVTVYRLTVPSVRYGEFFTMRAASYLPTIANYHVGQAFLTYMMSRFFRVSLKRMAGSTLLSYASWFGCLLGCMALALPFNDSVSKLWVPVIVGSGVAYLVVIAIAPKPLAKNAVLAPLFEAGLKGHAVALVARLPHLAILILGSWASMLFFHVAIPFTVALIYMPILLVATALPITPQGAGTRDAIAKVFFVSYAVGQTEDQRVGHVAAATIAWMVSNTIVCAVMGIIASRIIERKAALLPPP